MKWRGMQCKVLKVTVVNLEGLYFSIMDGSVVNVVRWFHWKKTIWNLGYKEEDNIKNIITLYVN